MTGTLVTQVTPQGRMHVGSETNADTPASFIAVGPTNTVPVSAEASGSIVISAPRLRNLTSFLFFGQAADNAFMNIMIWRWYRKFQADGLSDMWIPHPAVLITDAQLSTLVGVSGEVPSASDRFCDNYSAIQVDSANRQTEITTIQNAPFNLVLDNFGCQKFQVNFADGSATAATKGNFVYIGD